MAEFLQILASGLSVGAIYALIGIGFSMIYNTSDIINFAQGEFVMIGGMSAVALAAGGAMPLVLAVPAAIAITVLAGLAVERLAIEPVRQSSLVTLIIITIGVSITIRGAVEILLGKNFYRLSSFSGDVPVDIGGAQVNPQAFWVVGSLLAVMAALAFFFNRTRLGKAMLATAQNRLAAELMGIDVKNMLRLSFALSALLGALAGVLTAPITLTRYDVGIMLGLKGFCAAILGGLGTATGALAGGVILGLTEAMAAGYVSSAYKDAVAFLLILAVLVLKPSGLFGRRAVHRV
jgi:branched-chain amino acid transport system permease protein